MTDYFKCGNCGAEINSLTGEKITECPDTRCQLFYLKSRVLLIEKTTSEFLGVEYHPGGQVAPGFWVGGGSGRFGAGENEGDNCRVINAVGKAGGVSVFGGAGGPVGDNQSEEDERKNALDALERIESFITSVAFEHLESDFKILWEYIGGEEYKNIK